MKHVFALLLLLCHAAAHGINTNDAPIMPLDKTQHGELIVLAGSNTIGAKLAPAWAKAFLEAKGVQNVNVATTKENEYSISGNNQGAEVYITVKAHGSSTGFAALTNDSSVIAMASRPIKAAEVQALKALGDMQHYSAEHVVAIDGLAIIVHPSNPVTTISVDQLGKIFSGEIKNWRELGGKNQAIALYARDDKSGTWDTFDSLILSQRYRLSPNALRFESNDALSDRVSEDSNGIGFVGLASVRNAKPLAVMDGGTDALSPEPLLVATEDYPLARRLYLYGSQTHLSTLANEFIAFTQQTQGQHIVESVGFVSQNPVGLKMANESGSPFYNALTEHALRLSMNFRFQPGSAHLDSKAKRDVMRLAEFLKQPANRNLRVQLIGFSDLRKDESLSNVLSKLRASAVKRELFKHGAETETVEGFGAERPVASVSAKNDRVEVWIYSVEHALTIEKLKYNNLLQSYRTENETMSLVSQ